MLILNRFLVDSFLIDFEWGNGPDHSVRPCFGSGKDAVTDD
jgi:hypothetical protein